MFQIYKKKVNFKCHRFNHCRDKEVIRSRKTEQETAVNNALGDIRRGCYYEGALTEVVGLDYRYQPRGASLPEVVTNLRYNIIHRNMEVYPKEQYSSLVCNEYTSADDPIYRFCMEDVDKLPGKNVLIIFQHVLLSHFEIQVGSCCVAWTCLVVIVDQTGLTQQPTTEWTTIAMDIMVNQAIMTVQSRVSYARVQRHCRAAAATRRSMFQLVQKFLDDHLWQHQRLAHHHQTMTAGMNFRPQDRN